MNKVWVLCAQSIRKWFQCFSSSDRANALYWDEYDNSFDDITSCVSMFTPFEYEIVIISTHLSLVRDAILAERLRSIYYKVYCQSDIAIRTGLDKIKTKEFLIVNYIDTPELITDDKENNVFGVIKNRYGTEAIDMSMSFNVQFISKDYFVEKYYQGIEYSVNVFSLDDEHIVFPVVCKGKNSIDLIPPYKRMRNCFTCKSDYYLRMQKMSMKIAHLLNNCGFMEIEYLVTSDNRVLVLEINPRVSGTLRMSSMSAQIKCFDLFNGLSETQCLESLCSVIEFPCEKEVFAKGCYSTSRASISFFSLEELKDKLKLFLDEDEVENTINEYLCCKEEEEKWIKA